MWYAVIKGVLSLARTEDTVVVVYIEAEDNQDKGDKCNDTKGEERKIVGRCYRSYCDECGV
jgi:hypothetical protein